MNYQQPNFEHPHRYRVHLFPEDELSAAEGEIRSTHSAR